MRFFPCRNNQDPVVRVNVTSENHAGAQVLHDNFLGASCLRGRLARGAVKAYRSPISLESYLPPCDSMASKALKRWVPLSSAVNMSMSTRTPKETTPTTRCLYPKLIQTEAVLCIKQGDSKCPPPDPAKAMHGNRANSIVYAQFLYDQILCISKL